MAVFTPLHEPHVRAILAAYNVGEYVSHQGILQGIQNSNFHVYTSRGAHLILTIYEERTSAEALPFFFAYTDHLVGMGIPCPGPILNNDHQPSILVEGKPAALFPFLEGACYTVDQLTPAHCEDLGRFLARMHLAVADFTMTRDNPLSLPGWKALADKTRTQADHVQPGLAQMIDEEISYLEGHWPQHLPRGAIHADVFPDNVFFRDERVSAVIDFYYAVTDMLAYDLAIVVNAWCFDAAYQFSTARFEALMEGYQAVRALSPDEQAAMPLLLRAAAIRFLMTRLHDWVFHDPQNFVKPHDPLAYVARLAFFQRERLAA
jgi:homoserine kinase type II